MADQTPSFAPVQAVGEPRRPVPKISTETTFVQAQRAGPRLSQQTLASEEENIRRQDTFGRSSSVAENFAGYEMSAMTTKLQRSSVRKRRKERQAQIQLNNMEAKGTFHGSYCAAPIFFANNSSAPGKSSVSKL